MSFVRSIARQFSGLSSIETLEHKLEKERSERLELLEAKKQTRQVNSQYRGGGNSLQDEFVRRAASAGTSNRVRQESFEMVTRSREGSFEAIDLSRHGSFDELECCEPEAEPHFVMISISPKQSVEEVARMAAEDMDVPLDVKSVVAALATQYADEWIAQATARTMLRSEMAARVVAASVHAAAWNIARMEVECKSMSEEDHDTECEFPDIVEAISVPAPLAVAVLESHAVLKIPTVPSTIKAEITYDTCRHASLAAEALKEFYAARELKKQQRSVQNRVAEAQKVRKLTEHSSWGKVLQLIDNPEEHDSFATMQAPVTRMFHVLRSSAA
ncbi:Aste57867_18488 [Aphanomyces stellatus]|uniref:Aste57867_18488 protein n=1 Tax=Aphanomyces stellatus TaxID=120398 RepID=A0A485LBP7_9STRA|nr:hypothetical protein As57867_018426 [Aphanomyces stellatus]VFT95224.1 Aste57867_18488 [Aphanomyces stellatus]